MKIGGFWPGSFRLAKSMENSLENSHGTEIPKKSRSLDLKSLYESGVSREVQNKKLKRKVRAEDGDEQRNERRNKKKVSLSNFSSIYSKSRKSLDEVYAGALGSSEHDSKKALKSRSREKLNSSGEANKVPLILDENVMQIPKRKRGFVRRKKSVGQVLEPSGQADGEVAIVSQIAKTSDNGSSDQVECCKTSRKPGSNDLKENRENDSNSNSCLKEEGKHSDHVAAKAVSLPSGKSRRNFRKRKISSSESKGTVKKAEASVDYSAKQCDGFQEEDEANLEENAARMLSSRFDPNCTGYSSNSKGSSLPPANGLSFLLPSGHNIVNRALKSLSGSESASADIAGRVLRPRKQRKEKGSSRNRRHFYELFFGDLDAVWVLNRRIKVFWPLDQSWYYGLVNDYDKERKLHHVKYDDRDEEWIDLQNERFKLLLLPSEVPGKAERRKSVMGDNSKGKSRSRKGKERNAISTEDDCSIGSYMDSEPIISWLARSTHRTKSFPCHSLKRQKNSGPSLKSVSQANLHESSNFSYLGKGKIGLVKDSGLSERLEDLDGLEKSASEITSCSRTSKPPIVYFRKRFRNVGAKLSNKSQIDYVSRRTHGPLASFFSNVGELDDVEEPDIRPKRLVAHRPLWCIDDAGSLQLTVPAIEMGHFRFELSLPAYIFLNAALNAEMYQLSHVEMLTQYGTLTSKWPKVQFEMLFVDNVVGLRFFLFEGCLMQAVAFIFLILKMFQSPGKQGKYADLQFPVTSIRFKFLCLKDVEKQLVFAFYNFSEIKSSKWIHLDCRLKRHCLLTKQLPLTECTYDNIKRLQDGTSQFYSPPVCGQVFSVKGIKKISRLDVNLGAARVNIGHSNLCSNEIRRNFPAFALSFTAAPTFFLSLHLKLLMERRVAHISLRDYDSVEHSEYLGRLTVDDHSDAGECANSMNTSSMVSDRLNSCVPSDMGTGLSVCKEYKTGNPIVAEIFVGSQDPHKVGNGVKEQMQQLENNHSEMEQSAISMPLANVERSDNSADSFLNDLSVEIPSFHEFGKPVDGELHSAQPSMDTTWNVNAGIIPSPNPTAPRSTWHRNKNNSSSIGLVSHGWSDGKDFLNNGFGNRPKRPRTQVSYLLPFGGFDDGLKSRNNHPKVMPFKRIRKANEKRSSDVVRGSRRNLELLSCESNVLITFGDRGWRECGARVVLEVFDHNDWKLAVKLSGITKYCYKAHQFLQPGSTNRYTHAMMWKGGKDWTLEFPDRSQWALFKELHEECYNRNIRAASVKNIPIPGVCLIEENDESVAENVFMRNPSKYVRQLETDVEMALNPIRILYDMDSDDEQWITGIQTSSEVGSSGLEEVTDEMFEKIMDAFEKAAYSQQRDEFSADEIEKLMNTNVASGLAKTIYEYWQQKRRRNGMPLIRHLQPPLWETYQKQLTGWESAISKNNTGFCNGFHEKAASDEKPPMFAFCLKPRGLEVSNKGSKQRSHRKFSVGGHSNSMSGDHDGLHGFGRRLNGFSLGDDKMAYLGHNYDFIEESPLIHSLPNAFSPRLEGGILSNDGLERNFLPKLQKSKSKKFGTWSSSYDSTINSTFSQRTTAKRDGFNRWNNGFSEWSSHRHCELDGSQRQFLEQLDNSDLDEFRLRDASGTAQHARNMAKLKREKAKRLLYRADLAIHKAVIAIMTAEAIKAASEDSNGDG